MLFVAILAFLYLSFSLWHFGRLRTDYSHITHTISELAESKSITEKIVSRTVFLPVGVAMAIISILSSQNEPAFHISLSLAVGYCGAALFPIDEGAPIFGTWKNAAHSLIGGASYLLALAGFEHLSREIGFPYSMGKFLILAFIASLYIPMLRNFRGLLQRIAETAIFSVLLVCLYQSSS
jgi:hypothetical protein